MKKRKAIRKITRIFMALVLTICTVFTSVGTMGITEVEAADESGYTLENGILTIQNDTGMTNWTNYISSLGNKAQQTCLSVTEVVMESGVTKIGNDTFKYYRNMASVEIPNSVTSIGERAFSSCAALTSIVIPNSVTEIGVNALAACDNLTSVEIQGGITKISDSLFNEDYKLANVYIPNSVTSIDNYAFGGCTSLGEITIPASVKSIGDEVFSGCSNLAKVNMLGTQPAALGEVDVFWGTYFVNNRKPGINVPEGTEEAYKGAWTAWADYIYHDKGYTLENGTLTIETDAGMTNWITYINSLGDDNQEQTRASVTKVVMGNGVTGIIDGAFMLCSNMTSVEISDSVTSIGTNAFYDCSALESIDIPKSVTKLGENALASCSKLTSVEIPEGITEIPDYLFSYDTGLTSVTIPNSVISIGTNAFYDCSALEEITIPASVKSIGNKAFEDCDSLKRVNMLGTQPAALGGSYVFSYTYFVSNNETGIYVPEGAEDAYTTAWTDWADYIYKGYTLENGTLTIETDAGMTNWITYINSLGENAQQTRASVTNVVLGNDVTKIGESAFESCTALEEITIPASVTSIGGKAFKSCSSLKRVNMEGSTPANLAGTDIFTDTYFVSNNKQGIYAPAGAEKTYQDAWADWAKYIYEDKGYIFDESTGTLTITSNDGTTAWRDDSNIKAFEVKAIEIEDGVTEIGAYAFSSCTRVEKINIPDSIIEISTAAFDYCRKLEEINIPDGVKVIGDLAFEGCSSLASIKIPDNVTSIGKKAFCGCWALTSIVIPDGITEISDGLFMGCSALASVEIPNTVTTIGEGAFEGCQGLEKITIPASVTNFGRSVFFNCNKLKEVKMEGSTPATIADGLFKETYFVGNKEQGIKVPEGTVKAYKEAWTDWADYIYDPDSGSTGGNTGGSTSGKVNSEATVAEDSPIKAADLSNTKDELFNASGIFTEAEKEQIENGVNANVWLELKKADLSTVSETDRAAILDKAKEYMGEGTELTYFDASLFKQIEGGNKTKISEPGICMKLTIQIPTELLSTDSNVSRQYTIIRLHNGQAEEITGTFDETTGTFTFETDKFSTYAIAYKDTAKNNGGNNNGNNGGNNNGNNGNNGGNNGSSNSGNNGGNQNGNTNGNQTLIADNTTNTPSTVDNTNTVANTDTSGTSAEATTATPDTGDNSNVVAWLVVVLMGMAVIAAASRKRRA